MNLAGAYLNVEEHMEGLQARGFHCKEITGDQLLLVLAETRLARYCSVGHAQVLWGDAGV
jgi:hypothetical protein